jgi:hydroxymethylbilane synthase
MANPNPIYIATRGSALALAQANLILGQCRDALPDERFELKIIKTTGDKLQAASLSSAELPKGLFTKEIEEALISGEADLAVHSLKDLPTELPRGLKVGAVTARADVRDVVVYRDLDAYIASIDHAKPINQLQRAYRPALTIHSLPVGAVVATSSTRRNAQVLEQRPDLKVIPIRGNVGTRLKKLAEQSNIDATILAAAGLQRLNFQILPSGKLIGEDIPAGLAATHLTIREMIPCVGQAAIGIEIRENDSRLDAICARLNDSATHQCVTAERAFLEAMGGGCHLAVAAYAEIDGAELKMRAISFLDGQPRRSEGRASLENPVELGQRLAAEVRTS